MAYRDPILTRFNTRKHIGLVYGIVARLSLACLPPVFESLSL